MGRPENSDDVAALLRTAARDELPVVVRGAGTRSAWLPPLPPRHLLIETAGLTGAPSLRPANLTGVFGAGTPLAQVQASLVGEGLWLPAEALGAPAATLGGCLAAGTSSSPRLAHGTLRDWVLGLEVVTPAGRVVRLGGETVKNVAGYDLVKLHLGAWGRLGVITRVFLRLSPQPEAEATVRSHHATAAEAMAAAASLAGGPARPMAVDLLWEGAPGGAGVQLFVRLAGRAATLSGRVAMARSTLGASARSTPRTSAGEPGFWAEYAARWEQLARRPWRAKVSAPVGNGAALLEAAAEALRGQDWTVAGQAGSGVFTFFWEGELGAIEHLRAAAGPDAIVVAEGRGAAKLQGDGWVGFPPRAPRAQDRLDAAILRALDPRGLMNPHLRPLPGRPAASPDRGARG